MKAKYNYRVMPKGGRKYYHPVTILEHWTLALGICTGEICYQETKLLPASPGSEMHNRVTVSSPPCISLPEIVNHRLLCKCNKAPRWLSANALNGTSLSPGVGHLCPMCFPGSIGSLTQPILWLWCQPESYFNHTVCD